MSSAQTKFDDAGSTRGHAADGKALGEELKTKVTGALSRIQGIEASAPWGNDEPGRQFAGEGKESGYVPASQQYQKDAPGAGDAAANAFGGVIATVESLTGVDGDNETTIGNAVPT